jgi:hypothetical protein
LDQFAAVQAGTVAMSGRIHNGTGERENRFRQVGEV